ncbi:MAG: YfiR family protein [Oleiphilaceae bacterium]|nr:YfiR family protein [Oleiphilaceae bacterium]
MINKRLFWPLLVWLNMSLALLPVKAAEPGYSDGMVRAAVIFGILRFAEWPEILSTQEKVVLCAVGQSPAVEAIGSLKTLPRIGQVVVEYRGALSPSQLRGCQAVIMGRRTGSQLPLAPSALLICDECDPAAHGVAAINLMQLDNRIQFEVNLDRVREQKVNLSASLLELAARCSSRGTEVRGCND